MYFLHCSFVAIIFSSLLNTELPICCPLIAVFWGNLQELATHQWLVPGVVRSRGQSFSLPVAKLVIPADLCSPRQTYRLQPSHQHTEWSSCEPELLLLYQDGAAPRTTDWWWPLVACFQRSEASLKYELLPTFAVEPVYLWRKIGWWKLCKTMHSSLLPLSKKLTSEKVPNYSLYFNSTLYFKCSCVFNVN